MRYQGFYDAARLPISAPIAEFVLLGPDGEVAFCAEVVLDRVQLIETTSPDRYEDALRAAVQGVVGMRCAGSLCAIGWPG